MTTLFTIFALRGRDRDNPSLLGRSSENYEQRMELVGSGHTCTITSVQKDNLVLEIYKYDIMTARNILHTLKCEPKEGGVAVLD